MNVPAGMLQELQSDSLFQDWKKRHPQAFLSHFFCSLDKQCILAKSWEIGYFNPQDKKITVFVELRKGFEIKPADDLFNKEGAVVEELAVSAVHVDFEKVKVIFQEQFFTYFPGRQIGNGFVILQQIDKKPLWSLMFLDNKLKFLNLKINAETGAVEEHQEISPIR